MTLTDPRDVALPGVRDTDAAALAREVEQLRAALRSRDLIGQAKGILMERHGIDEDRAFAVLRRFSQQANVKLALVAEHLARTGEPPPASIARPRNPVAGVRPPD